MDIELVRLSLQRALLGYVTPNLRAVCFKHEDETIKLFFYYDKPPTEAEEELESLADTEFLADFQFYETICEVITLPFPSKIPNDNICVYRRYENNIDTIQDDISETELIRLTLQQILLGSVTPNLRAVCFNYEDNTINLFFYYDNPRTEDEEELASLVDTELMADFPSYGGYKTICEVITLSFPEKIPTDNICVYRRYENVYN